MLNKIKQTLNENDSQLELITIKRKKTMTKENKKTSIHVMLAQDLFIIAKQYEKKNQYIKAFTLIEDNFKLSKLPSGNKKIGSTFGFQSNIESFETEEITAKSTTIRKYERHDLEYRIVREVTTYND
jgi:hypothetical protein